MKKLIVLFGVLSIGAYSFSQQFEEPVIQNDDFSQVKVKVGADFALQYQMLEHHADSAQLIELGKGVNLPTANLNIDAELAKGIRVNLTTYLSSRHHVEAWVKGGYLLVDELPFLNSSVVDRVMDFLTIKAGVMELNYGDAHFLRSDNGRITTNPFVGNYIMDAFTTAPAIEVLFRQSGVIGLLGITTGTLKPALAGYSASGGYVSYNAAEELAVYAKAGVDKQVNEDLRVRATLSAYRSGNNHFGSLYNGDRTGSRYYLVMKSQTNSPNDVDPASGHMTGNWGPGFTDELSSLMANVFVKFQGAELFGTYEKASGTSAFGGAEFEFSQFAVDGLYRFGKNEQFFGGARFNKVSNSSDLSVNRIEAGAGWYPTENIVIKLDYVNQAYTNFETYGPEAGFKGFMFEAGISF